MALLKSEEELVAGMDSELIFKLLDENYREAATPLQRSKMTIQGNRVTYDGDLILRMGVEQLGLEIPGIIIERITGDFDCNFNNNLTSLKGAPMVVEGHFDCSYCENLKTLEGAPKKVGGNFLCGGCSSLTSLKGMPEVGMSIGCDHCDDLISLKGAPERCINFNCSDCSSLTDLKGSPRYIKGYFICNKCKNLRTLEGAPEIVGANFCCILCDSLKDTKCPTHVGGTFKYQLTDSLLWRC